MGSTLIKVLWIPFRCFEHVNNARYLEFLEQTDGIGLNNT